MESQAIIPKSLLSNRGQEDLHTLRSNAINALDVCAAWKLIKYRNCSHVISQNWQKQLFFFLNDYRLIFCEHLCTQFVVFFNYFVGSTYYYSTLYLFFKSTIKEVQRIYVNSASFNFLWRRVWLAILFCSVWTFIWFCYIEVINDFTNWTFCQLLFVRALCKK